MNLHALYGAAQKAGTQDHQVEQEIVRPLVLPLMARLAEGTARTDARHLSEVGVGEEVQQVAILLTKTVLRCTKLFHLDGDVGVARAIPQLNGGIVDGKGLTAGQYPLIALMLPILNGPSIVLIVRLMTLLRLPIFTALSFIP